MVDKNIAAKNQLEPDLKEAGSVEDSDQAKAKAKTLPMIHDLPQQARNLRHVLQDDKQRIGFLAGAGCPLGVYDEAGEESVTLIPAVVELTRRVASGLQDMDQLAGAESKFKVHWDILFKECQMLDGGSPTVEDVLTELRTLASRKGSAPVLGMEKDDLRRLDEKICGLIAAEVAKKLPSYRNAYNRFASWLGGVSRTYPVEIFTPNYDVLFEQSFEQSSIPHFDGFVGSHKPWFDLASIEHDAIPPRWTRLWKLHGSINWERSEEVSNGLVNSRVIRVTREAAEGRVMIYPSHLKYDQSRRMPYLAMLDRLRAFFHGKDAPRLVVCGYSFLDDHLNEVLLDGLRGNRNAQCFALMYSGVEQHKRAVDYARKQSNLTVLAWDGAVIGTRLGGYRENPTIGGVQMPWLSKEMVGEEPQARPYPRSRLGDFHYFGLFLEDLYGGEDGHA